MCGIAGYSLGTRSRIDRTLAGQALLAGIAERGSDAVGYAYRGPAPDVVVHKRRGGATALLDELTIPADAHQALVHVRDFTKGHPAIEANNHPIRHGRVVGVHNGVIANDDALLARHGIDRASPEMTVDSEAIFALVHRFGSEPAVLAELRGAMAAAWLDERLPAVLHVARGVGRPLWIGRGRHETFFASTRSALEVVERALRLTLRKTEVAEGRLLDLADGMVTVRRRWRADRGYRESNPLPAVRAPHEGVSCLARLAALAATA